MDTATTDINTMLFASCNGTGGVSNASGVAIVRRVRVRRRYYRVDQVATAQAATMARAVRHKVSIYQRA